MNEITTNSFTFAHGAVQTLADQITDFAIMVAVRGGETIEAPADDKRLGEIVAHAMDSPIASLFEMAAKLTAIINTDIIDTMETVEENGRTFKKVTALKVELTNPDEIKMFENRMKAFKQALSLLKTIASSGHRERNGNNSVSGDIYNSLRDEMFHVAKAMHDFCYNLVATTKQTNYVQRNERKRSALSNTLAFGSRGLSANLGERVEAKTTDEDDDDSSAPPSPRRKRS